MNQISQTVTTFIHQISQNITATAQEYALSKILTPPTALDIRPGVRGKFFCAGDKKLYIRGVTYGPFRPSADGSEYHTPVTIEQDFKQMVTHGINAIRTYTVPPRWVLDIAHQYGLYVMVGLPWEQHIDFLGNKRRARDIERRVYAGVRSCAGHPAILCYAIGNEIPASIVRWYGPRRIERYLENLYSTAKTADPEGLVTYVNFPTTEYLQLPFLDFMSFNVYLETPEGFEAYLARLQNIAGDRPLLMAEIGLDSRRHGEDKQASVLDWQIRTAFAGGCAGVFVFAWTDEWHRGGYDIEDWDFGLTSRDRSPKLALETVSKAFRAVPFSPYLDWPRISVIVCTYNGARTIRDCLEGLDKLDYPNFEVIVVDDGSKDATAAIAQEYNVRLIRTENRGLSNARNTGLQAATGEIVAYIDDDAYPDPHWLTYLAATFLRTKHAGVGGPNIAPPDDNPIAECVANSPGGPMHVLLSDREAEHIPGCNMAFRKDCLQAIGGFDPQFRVAGDDVDVCWRLRQRGWTLGFNPAAMVWHHRRNSIVAYWKQQKNYGKAEALLEKKWPEKYNTAGHVVWRGRLYGKGVIKPLNCHRSRIYQGTWGSALFQSIYQPDPGFWGALTMMPEWYLIIMALALFSILSPFWPPLLLAIPLLACAVGILCLQAVLSAGQASFMHTPRPWYTWLRLFFLTTLLHILQLLARLIGRLRHDLTPWRRHGVSGLAIPWPQTLALWSEVWQTPEQRLQSLEATLQSLRAIVVRGRDYDRWDLEVRDGTLGSVRLRMAIEEHGAGKQLVRFWLWPRCGSGALVLTACFGMLSLGSLLDQAMAIGAVFVVCTLLIFLCILQDWATATATVLRAFQRLLEEERARCNGK